MNKKVNRLAIVAAVTLLANIAASNICDWADMNNCQSSGCTNHLPEASLTSTFCRAGSANATCCLCTENAYACVSGGGFYYGRTSRQESGNCGGSGRNRICVAGAPD